MPAYGGREWMHMLFMSLILWQDCYPERLGKLLIINSPYIFVAVWKIVYPFIDKNTKKKVSLQILLAFHFQRHINLQHLFSDCFRGGQQTSIYPTRRYRWEPASWVCRRATEVGTHSRVLSNEILCIDHPKLNTKVFSLVINKK